MIKSFIALLIFCFPSFIVSAQINVQSFNALPTDQTARITDPVIDQNGEKCALIKVVSTQKGFVWEGGMLGIVKAEAKTGEHWVYVPHGAKKITIKHDQLGVLRNYIYPVAIREATVYEMVLTTATVKTIVEQQQLKSQWLVISSDPAGADVYVDDKHAGQTPFHQEFLEGKHSYRIAKELYHPEAGQLKLSSTEGTKSLDLQLRPNFGFAQIKAIPEEGANVQIDGIILNKKTPFKTERIKSGTHQIHLSHEFYNEIQEDFIVSDGETTNLNYNMVPRFADVVLQSTPSAEIYVDGQKVGSGTYSSRMLEGTYKIEFKKPMYHDHTETIDIVAGQAKTINPSLKPAFAAISIQSSPEQGAQVSVDGNPSGKITPCTLEQLPGGEHMISLRKDWYEPKQIKIQVIDGEGQTINAELIPVFAVSNITTDPRADIYIDNEKVGFGQYTGRVTTGIHTFEAKKEKHTSDNKKENIIIGNEYNIQLTVSPKLGTLKVTSDPFGAEIFIEGEPKGTTPKTFYDFLIGDYKLSIRKTGFSSTVKDISIREGETESVNVILSAGNNIEFTSTPTGAQLYVNEKFLGTTPLSSNLTIGSHKFKLEMDGYKTQNGNFKINEGSTSCDFKLVEVKPMAKFGSSINDSINCIENLSLYREYYKQWKSSGYKNGAINNALPYWRKTYNICPKSSENLYVDGVKIFDRLIKNAETDSEKSAYIDTVMMIYDQRIEYFPAKKGSILGRKGISFYKNKPSQYETAFQLFKSSVAVEGNKISPTVVIYYYRVAVKMKENNKISDKEMLEVFDTVKDIINTNINKGKNVSKWEKVQGYINKLSQNIAEFLFFHDRKI
jgi:PEGA domain